MSDMHHDVSTRLRIMLDLVRSLSKASDPQEVLKVYAEGMRQLVSPRAYLSLSVRGLKPGQFKITRFFDDMFDGFHQQLDPWLTWSSLKTYEGGLLGDLVQQEQPRRINDLQLADDPAIGNLLSPYRSLLASPLFDEGQALNWAIQLRRPPDGFTDDDVEESLLRSNLVGGTVRHVLTAKQLRQANDRIRGEVEHIARIQRGLLPDRLPQVPGLSLAAELYTYDQAGGDLYDVTQFREIHADKPCDVRQPWAILIADASGHGPAATTVGAMVHAILHTYPRCPSGPGEMLEHVNRHLCAKRIESSFVTALLAFFDPRLRTLTYARAGHPPAILKHPDGDVRRLDDVGSYPLGIDDDARYEQQTVDLRRGQTLVFYTDGITESCDPHGRMFGVEGVEQAARQCDGDPGCTVSTIFQSLRNHEHGARPADDQTLLAMQVMH
ncbi:MAG: SpoIIE family protein phosphatase [Phycisphaeraceae bacterium]|nr:SpoIIE family protein phosphatase [Phycisphaeraceae bacterium]